MAAAVTDQGPVGTGGTTVESNAQSLEYMTYQHKAKPLLYRGTGQIIDLLKRHTVHTNGALVCIFSAP